MASFEDCISTPLINTKISQVRPFLPHFVHAMKFAINYLFTACQIDRSLAEKR